MNNGLKHFRTAALAALGLICAGVAAPAHAAIVWDLNPNHVDAPAGSSSVVYTSQGYSITAYGFDNDNGTGSATELYYKNVGPIGGGSESGLGVVNTPDHELQAGSVASNPFDFIQFNFTSLLQAGATTGSISVGSVQPGESFAIYGSNALGKLGTQLGGSFGSSFDNTFVNLPNFGKYDYYSIVATADDVLPIAVSAEIPPVPEMNALAPVVGLLLVIAMAETIRRRRVAQS